MTDDEKQKCSIIIHGHAAAVGAGNALPAPGAGFAVDAVGMTSLAMSLCAVLGGNLSKEVSKAMGIAALKRTMLRAPIRTIAKEVSKFVPFLGQAFAPAISVAMVECAGWNLAQELDAKGRG